MKAELTWQGALVFADWLADEGRAKDEARWRVIGPLQETLQGLWEKWGAFWSATELRRAHEYRRRKGRKFGANVVEVSFAAKQLTIELYVRDDKGKWFLFGERYAEVAHTAIMRKTIAKKGAEAAFRDVALRLVKEEG